jgi:hypothetical protein
MEPKTTINYATLREALRLEKEIKKLNYKMQAHAHEYSDFVKNKSINKNKPINEEIKNGSHNNFQKLSSKKKNKTSKEEKLHDCSSLMFLSEKKCMSDDENHDIVSDEKLMHGSNKKSKCNRKKHNEHENTKKNERNERKKPLNRKLTIKKLFRQLTLKTHPDKTSNPKKHRCFLRIKEGYKENNIFPLLEVIILLKLKNIPILRSYNVLMLQETKHLSNVIKSIKSQPFFAWLRNCGKL